MFQSTFSNVQPEAAKSTTMNNSTETAQEVRTESVNKKSTKKGPMQMDIKQLLASINETESQLIMLLAIVETNPEFTINTMGAIQDVMTKTINAVRPHTGDFATIINEYNSITWELTQTIAISFKDVYPVMGEAAPQFECPVISKEEIDTALDMADKQVLLMNCTAKQVCDVIKGFLQVISKVKVMAPRIIRLMDKMMNIGKTMQAKFGEIKIDDYYAGNAFDQM